MKISYGITVHNESDELDNLLQILTKNIDSEDEIIIVDDYSNEETQDVIKKYDVNHTQRELGGDFASHKNYLIEQCSGDYVFQIDADEYPHEILLRDIKPVLEMNDVDLIWIPRINIVEGITEEHMKMWGSGRTEKRWINYPDFQSRVFRNSPNIRWQRKVHEQIQGCKTYSHLPPHEELSLYHIKTIEKQEKQNELYQRMM